MCNGRFGNYSLAGNVYSSTHFRIYNLLVTTSLHHYLTSLVTFTSVVALYPAKGKPSSIDSARYQTLQIIVTAPTTLNPETFSRHTIKFTAHNWGWSHGIHSSDCVHPEPSAFVRLSNLRCLHAMGTLRDRRIPTGTGDAPV